jgi:hypothetical protein
LLAALALHWHGFYGKSIFYQTSHGMAVYLIPRGRWWPDTLAFVLAAGGISAATGIVSSSTRRLAVAIAVFGEALAVAVYLYESRFPRHSCPRGVLCVFVLPPPAWWSYAPVVNDAIVGALAAIGVLTCRLRLPDWLGTPWRPGANARLALACGFLVLGVYALALGSLPGLSLAMVAAIVLFRNAVRLLRWPAKA